MKKNKTVLTKDQAQDFLNWLQNFLHSQRVLVMATTSGNSPYCNLMSFACTKEGSIIIITPRDTSKYENLMQNNHVSLLITDSCIDNPSIENTAAVTINGTAKEIEAGKREELEDTFIAKHPELKDFAHSDASALFLIAPVVIISPQDFYRVMEVHFD